MSEIKVIKASGEREAFSEEKVRQSLKRSGAKPAVINQVILKLIPKLYDGITTEQIYQQVFQSLNKLQEHQGYRYSLKNALMQLGPSGYPFEKFISRLLGNQGYHTQTNVIIQGQCISHEVDVVANKDTHQFLVECKFHNRAGIKTRIKTALYVQARFEDIIAAWEKDHQKNKQFHQAWLVTNTKLTSDVIAYGECKGMKLLAWKYPRDAGLEQLIEKNRLHPIACLTFLNRQEKQSLYDHDLVLCRDLVKVKPGVLNGLGFDSQKIDWIKNASQSFIND